MVARRPWTVLTRVNAAPACERTMNFVDSPNGRCAMILKKLREFLDQHHVKHVVISHSPAYTAQEIAQAAHVHGEQFAKTTIVKLDGELAMAVLPAPEKVDLGLLGAAARARKAELAHESDFRARFPECELGAMPPFGNLFDMHVYVDEALAKEKNLAFNAGSHRELVQMAVADFANLVKPRVARISTAYSS